VIEKVSNFMSDDNRSLSPELWKKALLPLDSTLQEAIGCLDSGVLQIAIVVEPDGALAGTLTDGDIRRGLLRGLGLDSSIDEIVFRDPVVAPPQLGREAVLQLMQANQIRQLPIVDESQRVVGLHLLDRLITPNKRPNLMVIMAGGEGARLRPHTENCPKPLLVVGDKPMLEHIIIGAKSEGFQSFILAVHYLGGMIEEYFGDGSRWDVQIDYLREETPLGTAGAISLLSPRPEEPFVVSNGDVLTDINYGEMLDFHCRYEASATMAVRMHEWQHPFGVVRTKGVNIIGFEEKPIVRNHINAGVYVLEPEVLDILEIGEHCDMSTLFSSLIDSSTRAIVYPMHEPWLDVGREDDLVRAQAKHPPKNTD
jgi:dTDP-glucose pyrophosphorylase/CBS domain-containing protein